jgi:iron complex outermembrane receptor protein
MIYHKKNELISQSGEGRTFKRSLLALCVMAAGIPALAQTQAPQTQVTDESIEEVAVTGMRGSLSSAQDLKRNAGTVIDSITAKDLGSFPDKSVAEALQRVPGITVNRFAASSDTAHFSAEPSGVLVRGLNQVRTEFNGRDSFSANASRGLGWGDVSPELMSGVDTYKNQMAELIEGGIAGTVNMRTRLPFDQDGQMVSVTASANYGDLSEKVTPELSGLYSNRWDTGAGEFGFLANLAYSEVQTRSEGNQLGRMNRMRNIYDDSGDLRFIPADLTFRDNLYDRERKGVALAAQWADADDVFQATLQYNRSEYENTWNERGVNAKLADLSYGQSVYFEPTAGNAPVSYDPASPFVFDSNGFFQSGQVAQQMGWWGMPLTGDPAADLATLNQTTVNSNGDAFVVPCYDWAGCTNPALIGSSVGTFARYNSNKNMTQDIGFNLKWAPSDSVRGSVDVQYVDSTVTNYDIDTAYSSLGLATVDLTGKRPSLVLEEFGYNMNYAPGFLSNANNYALNNIMDHVEDSEGDQFSLRGDMEFDLDASWAQSVKVGARFADRSQAIRWSVYNWAGVAPTWKSNRAGFANIDRHTPDAVFGSGFKGYPTDHYSFETFSSSYHDLSVGQFYFPNLDLLSNRELMASSMGAAALGIQGNGWDPICSNVGSRSDEISGTCFTPSEVVDVNEQTSAAYVQLNFGGDNATIFGVNYSGNFGVRYVETDLRSAGGVSFPVHGISDSELVCADKPAPEGHVPGTPFVDQTLGCFLSADELAFSNGAGVIMPDAKATHKNWLPSFNLRLEPADGVVIRYAWSTAISRPDMGSLRNYASLSVTAPDTSDYYDPLWVKDSAGDIVGANVIYTGDSHNAYLKPIEAKQHDLSFEYYWSDTGSASLALFQKDFDNYIQAGSYYGSFTNNGVTRTAEIAAPLNGDGAKIQGFELAAQTFFDFLPSPFDGFGVQANFTYVDNNGITNTNVTNTDPSGGNVGDGQAPDSIKVGSLESLSKESFTVIGMYEKNDLALRVAYSWRSEYMVTARDCCAVYPMWTEDQGHLDASIRYNLSESIELSLQGSNLLNTETRLKQQLTDAGEGGMKMPTSWFQNDRRYTLGVRFKY